MGIPYCANVQGLGTAFQSPGLARFVTALYRFAFRKVGTVFFENGGNAAEFRELGILKAEQRTVLHGAGINTEDYSLQPYPDNTPFRFLFLSRIMKEKGMDELIEAVRRLYAERQDFVLDLVGFLRIPVKSRSRLWNGTTIFMKMKKKGFQVILFG